MTQERGHSARAFTLAELIAVAALLTAATAALPPILASTRQRARQTLCSTNLRQIAAASPTYATSDPGENAIPLGGNSADYSLPVLAHATADPFGGAAIHNGSRVPDCGLVLKRKARS